MLGLIAVGCWGQGFPAADELPVQKGLPPLAETAEEWEAKREELKAQLADHGLSLSATIPLRKNYHRNLLQGKLLSQIDQQVEHPVNSLPQELVVCSGVGQKIEVRTGGKCISLAC